MNTEQKLLHKLFLLKEKPCPNCKREGSYHRHSKKQCYTCNCGKHHIYPRVGTIFECSSKPLTLWFQAIHMVKKNQNISAKEMERKLKVAYPTAWRMRKLILNSEYV